MLGMNEVEVGLKSNDINEGCCVLEINCCGGDGGGFDWESKDIVDDKDCSVFCVNEVRSDCKSKDIDDDKDCSVFCMDKVEAGWKTGDGGEGDCSMFCIDEVGVDWKTVDGGEGRFLIREMSKHVKNSGSSTVGLAHCVLSVTLSW